MNTIKRNIFLILIICALLVLGYYREFVFTSINAVLKAHDLERNYSIPSSLQFLENYEYNVLVRMKWMLTFLFSGFYLTLGSIAIWLIFKSKRYIYITIFVYIIVTVISGLLSVTGLIFESLSAKMYEFSRYLMGMLQSPVVLMILIPVFKLYGNENEKKDNKKIKQAENNQL